jgi:DNA-binding MarR family transcriptional regulator
VLLRRGTHQLSKIRDRELRKFGLSPISAGVLVAIQDIGDDATPAKISRQILREAHSISELVDRMEKKGLVTKVRDLERKNWVRVSLTDHGREAYKKAMKFDSLVGIISSLSATERRQLRSILMKLVRKALTDLNIKADWPLPEKHARVRRAKASG